MCPQDPGGGDHTPLGASLEWPGQLEDTQQGDVGAPRVPVSVGREVTSGQRDRQTQARGLPNRVARATHVPSWGQ